jgi:P4 family phage/plasmid primase-like protien
MLAEESAISAEVIEARGYTTVRRPTAGDSSPKETLKRCGIPGWARAEDARYPGLLIPLYRATGERVSWQYRPDVPPKDPRTGKVRKYAERSGRPSTLDIHPFNRDKIIDPTQPLWITEGIKKGDALTSAGVCVATLSGVFNWRGRMGSLGDWEDVPLNGREVIICFDADARTNPNVLRAMVRLGRWLRSKSARRVRYLIVPHEIGGTQVKGADDYLAAGGMLATLLGAARDSEPETDTSDDTFTDARLAEAVADDVLDSHFCWVKGLDWLGWDGHRWREVSDRAVTDAVRRYALDQFTHAAEANNGRGPVVDGWRMMLSAGRIKAVLNLASGIVEEDAGNFDAQPDLLNTPSGVVDLRTGELRDADSSLLLTHITNVSYRPGATHSDWMKALEALPANLVPWFQIRAGQGISGHTPPDDVLIVQQGGGENGKTTVMTAIRAALGDYYLNVSHRALLADPSAHSTELMDFRGARFAVLEELPEERRMSVVRLKMLNGTPHLTARRMHRDDITFDTTHTMFLSTNYRPAVEETDHGTWRRLALLHWPYTFRKPHEELAGPNDRRGDPTLRERVKMGTDGQHEAALAWLVEGAARWYAAEMIMPGLPPAVEQATRSWRRESDQILAYLDERIIIEPAAHVMATELLEDFNSWLSARGHRPWSDKTFVQRFAGHSEVGANSIEKRQIRKRPGLSMLPPSYTEPRKPAPPQYKAWLGLRFREDSDPMSEEIGSELQELTSGPEGGTAGTASQKSEMFHTREAISSDPSQPSHSFPGTSREPLRWRSDGRPAIGDEHGHPAA